VGVGGRESVARPTEFAALVSAHAPRPDTMAGSTKAAVAPLRTKSRRPVAGAAFLLSDMGLSSKEVRLSSADNRVYSRLLKPTWKNHEG
jgi:hypothetical protein